MVIGDSAVKMTFERVPPLAGVFAGTTYATAIVSAMLNQSLHSEKQVTDHVV